jgi:hypothetical protein
VNLSVIGLSFILLTGLFIKLSIFPFDFNAGNTVRSGGGIRIFF